ncbi:MAG: UDP-3-O-(3-hydroxymyristoyl)glucosamine N-acyltransferase [Pseudomonadota bacterium]
MTTTADNDKRTGLTAGVLAVQFGCELVGDPTTALTHVATLQDAAEGSLSFLANPRYRQYLETSGAAAVVVAADDASNVRGCAIVAPDPYLTFARMAAVLHPPPVAAPGIHASAIVDESAHVDADACVGPNVVIGARSRVAAHAVIGAGTYIGSDSAIGSGTRLAPNVTVMDDVVFGARCVVHAGAVIGSDGFGIARGPQGWERVPQTGGVRIGDDVDIGACTSIDRGAIAPTQIGNGVKLDNQIQIGHNTMIGDHTVMAGMVGIAGSTTIGSNCAFGGNSGTTGHLSIADGVVVTARATVTADITEAGTYGGVFPHEEIRQHQRNVARYRSLDKLARRVRALEKKIPPQE